MKITGKVILKKNSPAGSHYAVQCEPFGSAVGFVVTAENLQPEGTITIEIPEIEAPAAEAKAPAKKKGK